MKIKPQQLTALIDSREQQPLDLTPLSTESATLQTGDYTARGIEDVCRIERKSLPDLLSCVGRDRERFDREIERLRAFPVSVLVVEATWPQIELGGWRSKVKPNAVIGSLLGWQAKGIAVHLVGDHERAGRHVSRMLFTVARRELKRLKVLSEAIEAPMGEIEG